MDEATLWTMDTNVQKLAGLNDDDDDDDVRKINYFNKYQIKLFNVIIKYLFTQIGAVESHSNPKVKRPLEPPS